MKVVKKLKGTIKKIIDWNAEIEPAKAYDLWASTYDDQVDNPIVYLDEIVFNKMIANINMEGKTVVDIGCGTGKHWEKIREKKPKEIIGYEVSVNMLKKLYQKHPDARAYISHDNKLQELKDGFCDIIVSTLVLGYIKNLTSTFSEWNRVLKEGGQVFITDFHPLSLSKGAKRNFKFNNKIVSIKNYFHPLSKLIQLSEKVNWELVELVEKEIDNDIRRFYLQNNSVEVYERSVGIPLLYGCHFKKMK